MTTYSNDRAAVTVDKSIREQLGKYAEELSVRAGRPVTMREIAKHALSQYMLAGMTPAKQDHHFKQPWPFSGTR